MAELNKAFDLGFGRAVHVGVMLLWGIGTQDGHHKGSILFHLPVPVLLYS